MQNVKLFLLFLVGKKDLSQETEITIQDGDQDHHQDPILTGDLGNHLALSCGLCSSF